MNDLLLVNDKEVLNNRYRSGLMNMLSEKKSEYISVGIFDTPIKFVVCLLKVYWFSKTIFSSNLKANILVLLLFGSRRIILFNGLGRFRKSKLFRLTIIFLLRLNKKQTLIFQNYADYRYFKRHSRCLLNWVPGSGGVSRRVGLRNALTMVARDDKLKVVSKSILEFEKRMLSKISFVIVGCSDQQVKLCLGSNPIFTGIGYVPQQDIFKQANTFFQPMGYGEGVPHSLVDAIVSGMDVIINKKDFIRYGFHKVGFSYSPLAGSWVRLVDAQNCKFKLENIVINRKYIKLIEGCALPLVP